MSKKHFKIKQGKDGLARPCLYLCVYVARIPKRLGERKLSLKFQVSITRQYWAVWSCSEVTPTLMCLVLSKMPRHPWCCHLRCEIKVKKAFSILTILIVLYCSSEKDLQSWSLAEQKMQTLSGNSKVLFGVRKSQGPYLNSSHDLN